MRHLHQIFDKLHLSKENGLFITADNSWKGLFSNRVERLLENVIQPDAIFSIDNKPFILFFDTLKNKKKKLKEIWNFNESPIVIITEGDSLEIYNGFEFILEDDSLRLFGKTDKLNDFSYFELVTGKTFEKYQKDFSYSNRIDYHLLDNIRAARDLLVADGLSIELTNSLLGKVIFVRYLIDRKVKLDFEKEGKSRKWTNSEFCELLSDKQKVRAFFKYLKKKFNGDLFPISDDDINFISTSSLAIVVKLLSGDEVASGQLSLFNLYDFSIIPVEFISNVYELFIGQDQQENRGAYYTPLFLVDYILSETVEKKFLTEPESYNCKVLDPSCGSGIFLVETLRKIIEQFQLNNPTYLKNPDHYKKQLKRLASENIFGIDKDKSAVNVAIFSIYLTLLDYQEPSDIESFKFPLLYNRNFFSEDFFNAKAEFNTQLEKISFEFILGNPPWKRGKGEKKPLFDQYITERRKLEKNKYLYEIEISNSEIAQAFILRVSDFSQAKTKVGFIATSKVLYNLNARGFRKYLLDRFTINKVFELAPVRKEVFDKSNDKAVAPAVVLFYQFAFDKPTDENTVEHFTLKPSRFFSLFKVFTIQRGDYKKVTQCKLKEFDYLWKILVYGNYLDFNFISRVKKKYQSISNTIEQKEKVVVGQGIIIGQKDRNDDVTELIGKPLIDTRKDIKPFWVNNKPSSIWSEKKVHRSRPDTRKIFEDPVLLITGGLNKFLRAVSGVHNGGVVFKSSLTAISSSNKELLQKISGVLNSSFFSYVALQTFSSAGIEREEAHDTEKLSIPFPDMEKISMITSEISKLKQKYYFSNDLIDNKLLHQISGLEELLDSEIVKSFSCTDQEISLIDYSNEVTIPMLMRHKGYERLHSPLTLNSQEIEEYTELFLGKFNEIYTKTNQKLVAEIHYTDQLIGLFFRLIPINEQVKFIKYVDTNNDRVLKTLIILGNEKLTDRLFIQKDIRGFEKEGFYIVKPNEKRLWHKAIAYLDLNEFKDAILTAGKKYTFNVR